MQGYPITVTKKRVKQAKNNLCIYCLAALQKAYIYTLSYLLVAFGKVKNMSARKSTANKLHTQYKAWE